MATERKYDIPGRRRILTYLAPCRKIVDLGCNEKKIRPDATGYDLFPQFGIVTDFNRDGLSKVQHGFDGICMSHTLEHIIDVRKFLRECHDRLPPGGRIAIACPDGEDTTAATLGDTTLTHEMLFTAKTLKLYLKHGGFAEVISEYYQRPDAYKKVRGIFAGGRKP